jgi:Tol biopolymer transport system component
LRLLAALLAASVAVGVAAAAPEARPNAYLTFTMSPRSDPENGQYRICISRSDGTQRKQIVSGSIWAAAADWSPDGSEVVFAGENLPAGFRSADDGDVVVASATGELLRNLTPGFSADNFVPRWSPDGRWIAFISEVLEPTVVRADGSAPPATIPIGNFAGDMDWFPNGRLALTRFVGDDVYVFSVTRDGTGLRRIVRGTEPSVSPSGRRIAFARRVGRGFHVFVANADGSKAHRLTRSSKPESDPAWSPDGKWIAYERLVDPQVFFPHSSIVVTRADGTSTYVAVTSKGYDPVVPQWRRGTPPLPEAARASC